MEFVVNWLISVPGFAVPFALATLGLLICERSGVLNLGTEGFLLLGTLAGAGVPILYPGATFAAFAMSAIAAAAMALLFGFLVITLKINQVIIGLAMVFFAQGLTTLIANRNNWINRPFEGLENLNIPILSDLPIIGGILFNQDIFVYLTVLSFFIAVHIYYRTSVGLKLRAVGENPEAAASAGVSVDFYRYLAVLVGCAIIGIAGCYLSVGVSKVWVDGMSGGRGWIAVALVIFARWRFGRAIAGAILFGCIEAIIPRIAAVGISLPQYFVLMLPYVVTLSVMVWANLSNSSGLRQAPKGLGQPFVQEERT